MLCLCLGSLVSMAVLRDSCPKHHPVCDPLSEPHSHTQHLEPEEELWISTSVSTPAVGISLSLVRAAQEQNRSICLSPQLPPPKTD
jgi:hypothetical protein